MQLSTLLPVAALAWSARAFLLPPDVSGEALEAFKKIPDTNNHWAAHIECPDCPVQDGAIDGPHGSVAYADLDSYLVLDFSTNDENEITLGGVPIFPPKASPEAPFTVKQILKEGGDGLARATIDSSAISARMDFGKPRQVDEDGTLLSPFRLEILGVEGHVVHVDTATFDVLRDTTGHVYISNPQMVPSETTPLDASCSSVVCRVKAQVMAKVAAAKAKVGAFAQGCMRKMGFKPHHHGGPKHGAHGRPQIMDKLRGGVDKYRGKFGGKKPCPGKAGKHGHHGHHHGVAARVMHVLSAFVAHILMPILVGVAAGMAVSALGMVIGHVAFKIWMRITGRQNLVAVYHVVGDVDAEAALDDEPLPRYEEKEALPAYTEEKSDN